MTFSSYEFIFVFLPAVVFVHALLGRKLGIQWAVGWLVIASFCFYAWWSVAYLALLVASITLNYSLGYLLAWSVARRSGGSGWLLGVGVAGNLAVLGYFKYAFFLADQFGLLQDAQSTVGAIILPLGISFFTFEQIAYLVDVRRNGRAEYDPLRYSLFVAFFPRLVAGPILRIGEILPQLPQGGRHRVPVEDINAGLTLFVIGLFKKAFLADGIAGYVAPSFNLVATGGTPDLLTAWGGALAYTMQLYFDFSGYSDMAIGAGLMFGIRLPINFDAPYKALSISDFWRRWHITLSRFLRDYLYIPLGGNHCSPARRYVNLLITMLLGGLWHGAAWTFVVWGGLHGAYLIINHVWSALRRQFPRLDRVTASRLGTKLSWLLTFVAVVIGWVFFRAPSVDAAIIMLEGMAGLNGVAIPSGLAPLLGPVQEPLAMLGVTFSSGSGSLFIGTYLWIFALLLIALALPNSQQVVFRSHTATGETESREGRLPSSQFTWAPTRRWAAAMAVLGVLGLLSIGRGTEFLYWQF